MSPNLPQALFSSSLISSTVQSQLPEGYVIRPLEITDYHKGYYDCLAGLTVVGKVSEQSFQETFQSMLRCQNVYYIVVIEDTIQSRVVATGTLIAEQKFLRGCAKAGHIEDIVVHDSQRGKKFGIRLIDELRHIGAEVGCYKLLLTCSESNEPFYQKSEFVRKDLNMALYLNQLQQPQQEQPQDQPQDQPQPQQQQQQQQQQVQEQFVITPVTMPTSTTVASAMTGAEDCCNTNGNSPQALNGHGVPMEALSTSMESIFVK